MRALLICGALVGLLAACGGGERQVSPAPLPSGADALPPSFPLPDGAEQTRLEPSSGGGVVAVFRVDAPQNRVLAFYDAALSRDGWRILASDPTELFTVIRFTGNGWGGQLTIVKGPPTQMSVAMNPEPSTGG